MSLVAPKGRKHLSADALFDLVRNGFADIPDYCPNETDISLTDALMSAFAMFSLKSPSLLAFDKERSAGNWQTIYGMKRVPCDTHMRERLDPVSPESLRPVFKSVFRQLQRGKALIMHLALAAGTIAAGASCLASAAGKAPRTTVPQTVQALQGGHPSPDGRWWKRHAPRGRTPFPCGIFGPLACYGNPIMADHHPYISSSARS